MHINLLLPSFYDKLNSFGKNLFTIIQRLAKEILQKFKKMARKKRKVPTQFRKPIKEEKPEEAFHDEFQTTVGDRIEDFGKKFEGQGRTITYVLAGLGVLILIAGIFYVYNRRSNNAAQAALGDAIETSQAFVSESPIPGNTGRTFKTEKERAEASIKQFQAVVDKYGGEAAEKAKYFIATTKLSIDRPAAIAELRALKDNGGEVGTLSKFALAQALTDDGKLDEAAALYKELAALDDPILAKNTINIALAKIYEKQNKMKEAAAIYFEIAKAASEAKDAEGNPIPMSITAREAKDKLETLDPEKAKTIQEPAPQMPAGFPMGG